MVALDFDPTFAALPHASENLVSDGTNWAGSIRAARQFTLRRVSWRRYATPKTVLASPKPSCRRYRHELLQRPFAWYSDNYHNDELNDKK